MKNFKILVYRVGTKIEVWQVSRLVPKHDGFEITIVHPKKEPEACSTIFFILIALL